MAFITISQFTSVKNKHESKNLTSVVATMPPRFCPNIKAKNIRGFSHVREKGRVKGYTIESENTEGRVDYTGSAKPRLLCSPARQQRKTNTSSRHMYPLGTYFLLFLCRMCRYKLYSACFSRFFIMAPNMLHVGVDEKVSVKLFQPRQDVNVKMYLQDFPGRRNTFSQVEGIFKAGKHYDNTDNKTSCTTS